MPQGASVGKRSMKSMTAAFEGASASQKVKAAQWAGELPWKNSNRGGPSTSPISNVSYDEPWFEEQADGWWYCKLCGAGADENHIASSKHQERAANPESYGFPGAVPEPPFPYIAYVNEDGSTRGSRWPKCLLCDKWCHDAASHSGTHEAPAGSKEHQKNLRNYWPGDPWYEENVRKVHIKWHPKAAARILIAGTGESSAPQNSAIQAELCFVDASNSSLLPVNFDGGSPISNRAHDLNPWCEIRGGSEFCLVCNKYSTEQHRQSESHLRRLQYWSSDDSVPSEPWIEIRNGERYCLACKKWATPEHLSNSNHLWRAQLWAQSDDSVPGPWVVKREGENYCVACNKWCTEEHLTNDRHLWRVQLWAAGRGVVMEPTDVVVAVVEEVPLRGRRKNSNAERAMIVLGSVDVGVTPEPIPKQVFAAWPMVPRKKDVLLVPLTSDADYDNGGARPCLKSCSPLSQQEIALVAKRLKLSFQKSCAETCATMVAEYYLYMKCVLENVETPETAVSILAVLQAALTLAMSDATEKSGVGIFLIDASRSALVVEITPKFVCSGYLDSTLSEVLKFADQLAHFLPQALLNLKPLLNASYERRLELAKMTAPLHLVSAEAGEDKDENETLPDHWSAPRFTKQGWTLVTVDVDSEVFKALATSLHTNPDELHHQSMTSGHSHSKLSLKRAWRIENPKLWMRYIQERQQLLYQCYELDIQSLAVASQRQPRTRMPQLCLRTELSAQLEPLPDRPQYEVNEVRLLHAVKPESILQFAHDGLHPRVCVGSFGNGVHFAEDAGKCDERHTCDHCAGRKELKDLHSRLYGKSSPHPGDVYYVLLCRVSMGHFVRANRGDHDTVDLDHKGPVYSTAGRHELAEIPNSQRAYHSLVVEVGDQVRRYRELIQFSTSRIYPEYLLGYQRKV